MGAPIIHWSPEGDVTAACGEISTPEERTPFMSGASCISCQIEVQERISAVPLDASLPKHFFWAGSLEDDVRKIGDNPSS